MSKASFVPVGAMQGVNLASRDSSDATELRKWYQGPTLVDLIGKSLFKLSASHQFNDLSFQINLNLLLVILRDHSEYRFRTCTRARDPVWRRLAGYVAVWYKLEKS